jgi:hypothetical protein
MYEAASQETAADFLLRVMQVLPFRIHTVVTNNREPFVKPSGGRLGPTQRPGSPSFNAVCARNKIQHRMTSPDYPWSKDQVRRMELIYRAGARVLHHQTRHQAEQSMLRYHKIYNFGKRLKALKGLTPYEFICKTWEQSPEKFRTNPHRHFAQHAVGATSFCRSFGSPKMREVASSR